jgi:hypothetical protein
MTKIVADGEEITLRRISGGYIIIKGDESCAIASLAVKLKNGIDIFMQSNRLYTMYNY